MTAQTSFDVQPSTRVGAWIRRQGPAFWTGIAGAVLLLFAATSTVALAEQPDITVNFDDPEMALEWGSVTVWIMRGATLLAFAAVIATRVRRSRVLAALTGLAGLVAIGTTIYTLRAVDDTELAYITSFGAWFAFAGGALLLIAALALMRRE
jgi:drug/metabolite transporter superfamily protein YnfA